RGAGGRPAQVRWTERAHADAGPRGRIHAHDRPLEQAAKGKRQMDIESTTSIARPAAAVFAFVSDVRNDPQWHTDILEAKLTADGPIGVGSVFEIKFKPFMGQSRGTTTVARYEPPHHVVFETQMGKMAPTVSLTVDRKS